MFASLMPTSRTFPGEKNPGKKSRTVPGHVLDTKTRIFPVFSRKFPGKFQEFSRTFPGHIPEYSRKFPGKFQERSRKMPGQGDATHQSAEDPHTMSFAQKQSEQKCRMVQQNATEAVGASSLFLEWLRSIHYACASCGRQADVRKARDSASFHFCKRYSLSKGRLEHMADHVLELSVKVFRLCSDDYEGKVKINGLLGSLGRQLDKYGNVKRYQDRVTTRKNPNEMFEPNIDYLKSLLAAAFGDKLMFGTAKRALLEQSFRIVHPGASAIRGVYGADDVPDLKQCLDDRTVKVEQKCRMVSHELMSFCLSVCLSVCLPSSAGEAGLHGPQTMSCSSTNLWTKPFWSALTQSCSHGFDRYGGDV